MHNLLTDPILSVQDQLGSVQQLSLPQLLEALSRGEVRSYPAMRSHQLEPWHVFTVQLAASVLTRHPRKDLPTESAYWEEGLRGLSAGQDCAWHLCEPDLTKPAFLQHPLKSRAEFEGSFKPKEPKARTPDQLDILVTAKNHEVKSSRLAADDVQAWVYSLVCYQTFNGVHGSGNYGSIRMNAGHGNRPVVSMVKDRSICGRFHDEVPRLVAMRENLVRTYRYQDLGPVLTWLTPWGRTSAQWDVHDLDPYFIEAVRAVRMVPSQDGTLAAYGATTKGRQVGPAMPDSGLVGDPWIPINLDSEKEGGAALTVNEAGWDTKKIVSLLFKDRSLRVTPLQEPQTHDRDLWLLGYALARGQGKTEGVHRFELPVPAKAVRSLFGDKQRATFGAFATELLADADVVRGALRLALFSLEEGGPDQVDTGRSHVGGWIDSALKAFQCDVDQAYYPHLWNGAEEGLREGVRTGWRQWLTQLARARLDLSAKSLPANVGRRYKAIVRAHALLTNQLRSKGLLQASASEKESVHA